jgi:cell division initiation protein
VRITPLDLRKHRFSRRFAGYSAEEVDEFLRLAAEDYEAALRQIEAQRAQIARLEERVEGLAAKEQVLQDTLTTAQKLAEDLKRTAIREAEVLVGEAEVRGEKVLEAAHRRAARLAQDIRDMKQLRTRVAASLRATLESHLELLAGLTQEPEEDPALEGKVSYMADAREGRPKRET